MNDRGLKDAPAMARRLLDKGFSIQQYISSSAMRAKTTAQLFCKTMGADPGKITLLDSLYHAPASIYLDVAATISDNVVSAAIFGHNPGITHLANLLTKVRVDNMPTASVFAVRFTGSWKDFDKLEKELLLFDWPKNKV